VAGVENVRLCGGAEDGVLISLANVHGVAGRQREYVRQNVGAGPRGLVGPQGPAGAAAFRGCFTSSAPPWVKQGKPFGAPFLRVGIHQRQSNILTDGPARAMSRFPRNRAGVPDAPSR